MSGAPQLLIAWEPRWQGFVSAIGPALAPSARPLAGECRSGGSAASSVFAYSLHLLLLIAVAVVGARIPRQPALLNASDIANNPQVIYFSGIYLPRIEDAGGAPEGLSGKSGGSEALSARQVIRVARGQSAARRVVDAPKLKLPVTKKEVANLLALAAPKPLPAAPAPKISREPAKVQTSSLPLDVVPPPVAAPTRDSPQTAALTLPEVVEPAPALPRQVRAAPLHAPEVAPPAPEITGAPTTSIVISSAPGATLGQPAASAAGALAMSPTGSASAGLGGSGGGAGIGSGQGSGNAASGAGPGSGTYGGGVSNAAVGNGISASPGPGGTGNGVAPVGSISGVTVRGGVVMLPSFATGPAAGKPLRSPTELRRPPAVTVVGTSRSGGALNAYGALKGARVYTIYIDTRMGLAVMEYAERSGNTGFQQELTAPEAVSANLPSSVPRARVVVACVVDRSGLLRNLRVLESVAGSEASVIAALQNWRFRPVLRGDQAIEVDAILGLNVDTR